MFPNPPGSRPYGGELTSTLEDLVQKSSVCAAVLYRVLDELTFGGTSRGAVSCGIALSRSWVSRKRRRARLLANVRLYNPSPCPESCASGPRSQEASEARPHLISNPPVGMKLRIGRLVSLETSMGRRGPSTTTGRLCFSTHISLSDLSSRFRANCACGLGHDDADAASHTRGDLSNVELGPATHE